ncbi:hypothetical protein [Actinoplanes rectilineatus]|uniref:hypothetical protein n=1 Tax=Actinoplanes rectilineatus TaxID=113571 RepID=UPI000B0B1686|nr:hypothetical protein [Actinoplanes rectilineatus]
MDNDEVLRVRACRDGLLRWFHGRWQVRARMPLTGQFADDEHAEWAGRRFSLSEIQEAAGYLADRGLILGVTVAQVPGPFRADITTDGIDCVTDWAGDVAGYLRDRHGPGPTTVHHGPVIHGDAQGNQWAWGNHDVTQHQSNKDVAPGFEALAEAVAAIVARLPAYQLGPDDRQDAEDAAAGVLEEITGADPEPRRVRRAVAALRGFLVPIAANAAGTEVQALAQQGIDQLNAAIGM